MVEIGLHIQYKYRHPQGKANTTKVKLKDPDKIQKKQSTLNCYDAFTLHAWMLNAD